MVPRAYVPAFFGHAKEDTFVRPHHSERLHSAYAGDKEIMLFDNCDHNSPRPLDFYAASASFLARALHVYFDMQMLPSMMSETSMLMPNEAGETLHPSARVTSARDLSRIAAMLPFPEVILVMCGCRTDTFYHAVWHASF